MFYCLEKALLSCLQQMLELYWNLSSAGFCGPALVCPDGPELTISSRGPAKAAGSPENATGPSKLCPGAQKHHTDVL